MKCHIKKSNSRIASGLYFSGGDSWTDNRDDRFIFESMRAAMTKNKMLKGVIQPES
jgi:hypothetical protein